MPSHCNALLLTQRSPTQLADIMKQYWWRMCIKKTYYLNSKNVCELTLKCCYHYWVNSQCRKGRKTWYLCWNDEEMAGKWWLIMDIETSGKTCLFVWPLCHCSTEIRCIELPFCCNVLIFSVPFLAQKVFDQVCFGMPCSGQAGRKSG